MFTKKKIDTPTANKIYEDIERHTSAVRNGLDATQDNFRTLSNDAYSTVTDPTKSVKLIAQEGTRLLRKRPYVAAAIIVGGLLLGYKLLQSKKAVGFEPGYSTDFADTGVGSAIGDRLRHEVTTTVDTLIQNLFGQLRRSVKSALSDPFIARESTYGRESPQNPNI